MNPFSAFTQAYPPKPTFTGPNLPSSLSSKVYLITGANTGVGKALAGLLYAAHAKVYIAARTASKANDAISSLQAEHPDSKGQLIFLQLDLADLPTIKASAEEFLRAESRLDVLFNNAGVMLPEPGSKTKQGYELQLGTNNVGHHLFTKFLTPILIATAKAESQANPANDSSVRIIWVSSSGAEAPLLPSGGVDMDNLDFKKDKSGLYKYCHSKAGNYLQATEFARRYKDTGVISVALNPGNLSSDLYRTRGSFLMSLMNRVLLHPTIYGAYTELFAGLSPEVTREKNGSWGMSTSSPFFHSRSEKWC